MGSERDELLRRIRELRGQVDPNLLERARQAAFGEVPYDRAAAKAAVGAFLEDRDDGGVFRRKLEQALSREGVALDLEPEKPTPPPAPRRRGGRLT